MHSCPLQRPAGLWLMLSWSSHQPLSTLKFERFCSALQAHYPTEFTAYARGFMTTIEACIQLLAVFTDLHCSPYVVLGLRPRSSRRPR